MRVVAGTDRDFEDVSGPIYEPFCGLREPPSPNIAHDRTASPGSERAQQMMSAHAAVGRDVAQRNVLLQMRFDVPEGFLDRTHARFIPALAGVRLTEMDLRALVPHHHDRARGPC